MKPKFLIPAGILAAAGVAFGLFWFEPQALFIDKKVDETAPISAAASPTPTVEETIRVLQSSGSFRSLAHKTSGQAILDQAEDGNYYVRFETFETENGPDVRVYLSTAAATEEGNAFIQDFIDLGDLKGNIGDQNYQIPHGTDLAKYRSVVVWCRRFKVGFGVAPLETLPV